MTAITVVITISATGVTFLIYVFIALCRERRGGACRVVHIMRQQEQHEVGMLPRTSREAVQTDGRARRQEVITAGSSRAM
jgi:hypothetical protein